MEELKIGMVGNVNAGKCEKCDTPIIMHDGTIKMIQDIKVGDILMGDDSTPRKVLLTTSGNGKMYDINSTKYSTYTVNYNHRLSLKASSVETIVYDKNRYRARYRARWMENFAIKHKDFLISKYDTEEQAKMAAKMAAKTYINNIAKKREGYIGYGDIVDISIMNYLKLSKNIKNNFKGYKVGIDFEEKQIKIDPYILGYWLGDGHSDGTKFTTADREIVNILNRFAENYNLKFNKVGNSKYTYNITTGTNFGGKGRNKFMNQLKEYNLINNKHIPYEYKCNSRINRMKILAGLIDSDGHYNEKRNTVTILSKFKKLAYDIYYLAGSLGLGTTINNTICTCTNGANGPKKGQYYRVHIAGYGQENIPTVLNRKKIKPFNGTKNPLVYDIKIYESKETEYYGFELDGNGRYLHSDFVVTHNSSSTSVLIHKILDDGRGSARQKILKHKHEKDTGRTSSITENYLQILDKNKYISFVDLAGHEKYLKTTMYGLSGYYIDYAIIFVGANMGLTRMTQEHLILCITLKIPFIFVVTKIDITPENILINTINDIQKLVKRMGIQQCNPLLIDNNSNFDEINIQKIYPIFKISNKDGRGIDELRDYILQLKSRYTWDSNSETNFSINHKYNVNGIGTVFSGKVTSGKICKNDKLLLGPFYGKWINVIAKSLHDNFRNNVEELKAGEGGCVAIKSKSDFTKGKIRKGLLLINKLNNDAIRFFDAEVAILTRHSTTMRKGYSPIINCRTIVQTAIIIDLYDKDVLRCGDKAKVKFKFTFRPEFIREGDRFVFRDGRTKGFGKIIKIYDKEE